MYQVLLEKLPHFLLALIFALLSMSAKAENTQDFLEFARAYAGQAGYSLSENTKLVISEGIQENISDISADPNRIEDVKSAIRVLIDDMRSNALDAPDTIGPNKPAFSDATLVLALNNICPLWPICR